jgi:hypothetical protein
LYPHSLTLHSAAGLTNFALSVYPAWIPPQIAGGVEVSWIALSVGTTTVSTIIIVTRILLVSRMPGASKQPHLAVEIIIESAALYSISALIYVSLIPVSVPKNVTLLPYGEVFFTYLAVSPLSV